METMKNRIKLKRRNNVDHKVDEEIERIIPNPGHSSGRDYKYTETLDLYWHVKEFISYIIERK